MIITKSPLRISIAGGSTDVCSYAKLYTGFWISASIDKFVFVTVTRPFQEGIYLKYSQLEKIKEVEQIKHSIIRECLNHIKFNTPQIEITTLADIPAGTGLGSSSSFTTALLKALYIYRKKSIDTKQLAQLACEIEIDKLKAPIGIQDQYISAYGGVRCFEYDGVDVITYPLNISYNTLMELEDNLLLFFSGFTRDANKILAEQDKKTKEMNQEMIDNLHQIKIMGIDAKKYLEDGNIKEFGNIMNHHWNIKKQRSNNISNPQINEWVEYALQNGAMSAKNIGAGGGGFILTLAKNKDKLRQAMSKIPLEEVRFKFDFEGTKCIL